MINLRRKIGKMNFDCADVINLKTMKVSHELKKIIKYLTPHDYVHAHEGSISYFDKQKQIHNLSLNKVGLLITNFDEPKSLKANNIILHENPRFVFAKICQSFFPVKNKTYRIDKNIRKNLNLTTGKSNFVSEYVSFGKNISIGNFNNLGCDGFSVEMFDDEVIRIPHYGNVVIFDDVIIGNNTTICKSVFNSTIIGNNVQIDDGVHIAHNVKIGNNSIIAAHSVIAGSVTIGANCRLGVNVVIENGVTIGDNTVIGSGAVVLRSAAANSTIIARPGVGI